MALTPEINERSSNSLAPTEIDGENDCGSDGSSYAFESLQNYVDSLSQNSDSESAFTCQLVPADTGDPSDARILHSKCGNANATIAEINTIVFRPIVKRNDPATDSGGSLGIDIIYAVAIVRSSDKVDVRAFSEELLRLQQQNDADKDEDTLFYDQWELAPSNIVRDLCGFEPGTIPPLLVPPRRDGDVNPKPNNNDEGNRRPFATIVDSSLTKSMLDGSGDKSLLLLGGGGSTDHRCLIDFDFLVNDVLEINNITNSDLRSTRNAKIASIIRFDGSMNHNATTARIISSEISATENGYHYRYDGSEEKPFFRIAPPPNSIGSEDSGKPHRPIPVTALGRLTSVRQIAKRLVFADFAPPEYDYNRWLANKYATYNSTSMSPSSSTSPSLQKNYDKTENGMPGPPWRSGEDGKDMYVQIIVGKTFCERYDDGTDRLKRLKPGKLVLVRGAANVDPMQKNGWRNSAGNWAQKRSLDVIVSSFEVLEDDEVDDSLEFLVREAEQERAGTETNNGNWNSLLPWDRKNDYERRAVAGTASAANDHVNGSGIDRSMPPPASSNNDSDDSTNALTLNRFNSHLRDDPLDIRIVDDDNSVRAMAKDVSELLSRIEPGNQTRNNLLDYVMGIDCEWRPTGAYAEALLGGPDDNPVSLMQICLPAIGKVYLVDTLRTLRANLANTEAMTESEAILSETIGSMFVSKNLIKVGYVVAIDFRRLAASFPHIPSFRNVRSVVELSTLAERLHPKSAKPWLGSLQRLTKLVLGYNITKEQQCSDWEARPLTSSQIEYATLDCALPPRLLDEMAEGSGTARMREVLPGVTKSWRFQTIDGARKDAIRRVKAKRVVGSTFVVSQTWPNHARDPDPTSIPEEGGGPYTDMDGLLKTPSDLVSIGGKDAPWKTKAGKTVEGGKKSHCIKLLVGDAVPDDSILDYNPRSGFITFKDGLALFVNMPDPNRPSRRRMPYPNEWLEDGRILTWYIRKNDWNGGDSETAKLLLGSNSDDSTPTSSSVVLFTRVGNGNFVCCGSCNASVADGDSSSAKSNKKLVKLNLHLNDWETMKDLTAFCQQLEAKKSPFQKRLAQAVVDGNIIGAFGMALEKANINPTERSIDNGRGCVRNMLSNSDDPLVLRAMEIIDSMV